MDECEGQRDIEWVGFAWIGGPLARLEGDHEVHPAHRVLGLERLDEVGAEDLHQQRLEVKVNACQKGSQIEI